MCGRTSETAEEHELQAYIDRLRARYPRDFPPRRKRWNIAPSQPQLVIADVEGERQARWQKWGFVPAWGVGKVTPMINARAETIATKPMFRDAFRRRRGLVVVDGFYEWRKNRDGTKTPFRIHVPGGGLFAMAAIWERAGDVDTCAIITSVGQGVMVGLHDRMPVILRECYLDAWLSSETSASDAEVLMLDGDTHLVAYPVTEYVNSPRNDSAMCWDRDESVV